MTPDERRRRAARALAIGFAGWGAVVLAAVGAAAVLAVGDPHLDVFLEVAGAWGLGVVAAGVTGVLTGGYAGWVGDGPVAGAGTLLAGGSVVALLGVVAFVAWFASQTFWTIL